MGWSSEGAEPSGGLGHRVRVSVRAFLGRTHHVSGKRVPEERVPGKSLPKCNENRKNESKACGDAVAAQPVCPAHPFVFMLRNFLQRHNDCRNPAGQPSRLLFGGQPQPERTPDHTANLRNTYQIGRLDKLVL